MATWRVEHGGITTGDHYVVGPSGRWILAGNTQHARELADFLNNAAEALAVAKEAAIYVFALFDQRECDCDSSFHGEGWPAPLHANNCPVYERWRAIENKARRFVAERWSALARIAELEAGKL